MTPTAPATLTLDFDAPGPADPRWQRLFADADPRLVERFLAYHERNPDFYALFTRFADQAREAGRVRFSHWMIGNRIRWYTAVETSGRNYKVSNDYLACFVRLLVYERPEFDGLFTLRPMKPVRSEPKE
jgi:hypothetical protein